MYDSRSSVVLPQRVCGYNLNFGKETAFFLEINDFWLGMLQK